VKLVSSYISKRTTNLCLPGYNTNAFLTHTSIPHGSSLSLIHFFFYTVNLVDACNLRTLPT
jgi:hypothetical protein